MLAASVPGHGCLLYHVLYPAYCCTDLAYTSLECYRTPPPQSGWTTQFNGVYQVCKHCMLTQSTQLGCSCAWALASTQTHKLVQSMPMQKPYNWYNEGAGLRPFKPCPKVSSTYLVIFTPLDLFLRELSFFQVEPFMTPKGVICH